MILNVWQANKLLASHGAFARECCDRGGQILGAVRFTRRGETGVFCSRECRGDAAQRMIRRGGRPRSYASNAYKQSPYRGRILGVTKPTCNITETKGLQALKPPLSTNPFGPPRPVLGAAISQDAGSRAVE